MKHLHGARQHYQAGLDLGSTGEEKEGKTQDTEREIQGGGHSRNELEKTVRRQVRWTSAVDGLCSSWGKRP